MNEHVNNIELQNTFRALADPTRRNILVMLAEEDLTIAQVSQHFDITRAAVKKHLNILEEGNLISVQAKGRERINHLEPNALKPINKWVKYFDQFWDERLNNLEASINRSNKQ